LLQVSGCPGGSFPLRAFFVGRWALGQARPARRPLRIKNFGLLLLRSHTGSFGLLVCSPRCYHFFKPSLRSKGPCAVLPIEPCTVELFAGRRLPFCLTRRFNGIGLGSQVLE
jgi:hypothetical protein